MSSTTSGESTSRDSHRPEPMGLTACQQAWVYSERVGRRASAWAGATTKQTKAPEAG